MGRIVVGVDGSPSAKVALAWAVAEARLRGDELAVLCVYTRPSGWLGIGETTGAPISVDVGDEELAGFARQTIDAMLADVDTSGVTVERTVSEGRPGAVLTATSADADLLVVGTRGHGDLSSVLLGSVGMHCVHHAPCPVVVVRGPDAEGHRRRRRKGRQDEVERS